MDVQKKIDEKQMFIFCMITTFIWGIIAHAYCFMHSNFSHDSLTSFYANMYEERVKVALGRFIVPIYRNIRGDIAIPWVIGILALIWMGIAVYLIVKIFNIVTKKHIILISGIMTVNITVIALMATYVFEADADIFSLLMAVLAVYIWKKKDWLKVIFVGAPCVMISIGIYQSYLAVTISLIMFASIIELLENQSVLKVFFKDIKGITMVGCGGVLYYIFSQLSYKITGIVPLDRTNVLMLDNISEFKTFYIELFKNTYTNFFTYINNITVYPQYFEILIGIVMPLIVISMFIYVFKKNKKISRSSKLFAIGICGVLPFGANITYFLARGEGIHDLMTYATWMIFVMFLVFVAWFEEKFDIKSKIINWFAYGLVAIILWGNVILANTAYLKKDIEAKAAYSLMIRVVEKMEAEEQYVPGVTPVAFIGSFNISKAHAGFDKVSNIVGLSDNLPLTYYETYPAYLKYVLNYPLESCTNKDLANLKAKSEVKEIKPYPSNEYVQMIDGILVVKVGEI